MLKVRLAVDGDAESLARLCDVVHSLHLESRPDFFKPVSVPALRAWFDGTLRNPKASVWLAEASGQAVGYLLVLSHERAETLFCPACRWCEFDQIAVLPGQRRLGVARALIERALAEALEAGFERCEMQCWAFNDVARAAFERLGFTPKLVRLERLRQG